MSISLSRANFRDPLILCVLVVAAMPTAYAQGIAPTQSTAALPRFEVATVKPVDPNSPGMTGTQIFPGGRVVISGVSLKRLIGIAFRVSPWQVSGANGWMDSGEFNIVAMPPQPPANEKFNLRFSLFGIEDERLRQMLQDLLIDRFQLSFHSETHTGPVYLLEADGKKLNLHPAKPVEHPDSSDSAGQVVFYAGEGWSMFNTSMPQLARSISDKIVDRPVLDRTGLQGAYGFQSSDVPTSTETTDSDLQAAFFAFLKEAGLKLQSATGQVETLVIDHASLPSPN